MATVSLKDLTKSYGDIRAVNEINIEVREKEFLTILGPSGCGKTTLLRMIAGLETPTKGDILIDGISMLDVPTRERDIAMVFQTYALYNHMTAYDNIAFPLKMRKVPQQEIDRKVKDAAELLGIKQALDRKPGKLSGGEQQRVALGRAIVREPKVFLMDEPLTFLDPKLRTQMRVEIKTLQRRLGVTTIYVTHDQAEAMTMSDRIGMMRSGVLQQIGTPEEIYYKPVNTFVASFLGSPLINLINCKYTKENGKAMLDAGAFEIDITDLKGSLDGEKGVSEVILGIRPEDISVSRKKSASSIESDVYLTEPLGSETNLLLKVGGNNVNTKVGGVSDLKAGDKVWITFDKNKLHLFKSTGEAIQ
ncbi:MAG: ABC transporter ATP-binding protein [Thaumarchaeota archaeon]|nr:ABC transporter ATP-binding protein [Nitrososphaerota archaeon]MCL5318047.1 ABC transporter ATP-binding protein [Nitrososphaerota archaeon]